MTRDEWRTFAGSAPATPNQVGVIRCEMDRLGIADPADLLATTATPAGLGRLGSTKDLDHGGGLARPQASVVQDWAELKAAAGLRP